MIDLKPCPFCGNTAPRLSESCMDDPAYATATVCCDVCGGRCSRRHRTIEAAVDWWNSRPVDAAARALVAALCEDCMMPGVCNTLDYCKRTAELRAALGMAPAHGPKE